MHDNRCELTDLVLAHFLDGALDDLTVTQAEELALHREECGVCRDALARARRLDALLAASVDDHDSTRQLGERFDAMLERALAVDSQPTIAPESARGSRFATATLRAAALVMVGVFVSRWWSSREDGVTPKSAPTTAPIAVQDAAEPPVPTAAPTELESSRWDELDRALVAGLSPAFELTDHALRRSPRREPTVEQRLHAVEAALSSSWLPYLAAGLVAARPSFGDVRWVLARRFVADCSATGAWDRASALLVAPSTSHCLAANLAEDLARSEGFVASLRSRLRGGDQMAVRAAVPLQSASLDEELLVFARGDELRSEALIAALREPVERRGRAVLLSRLIEHSLARGGEVDELERFARVFSGLDRSDTAELLHALDRSRSVMERRTYLLALGALGHADAANSLLRVLTGSRIDEAELAAWALGRLPLGCEDVSDARFDPRRRALLFAARSSRGEPAMRAVVESLILSSEEADFLRGGAFRPQQIAIAARLFRRVAASRD
jgi:hypothetical protein